MFPLSRFAQDGYIVQKYFLERQKIPFLASFKLTYRCNLHCRQCPFFSIQTPELTFAQVNELLDRLYQRGSRIVIFEGGEPLLWHDGSHTLAEVVALAKRKFFSVGVTTNGTLPLNIPADVLWVSIDGLAATHNALRNADIFDRVVENIRQSEHPRIYAHITVNAVNASEIPELLVYLHGLVQGMTVQFYYPYGQHDELFLDFDRREALLTEIIRLKRRGIPILNSIPALEALKRNTWHCSDWLLDCVNPDGTITQGCYLKSRTAVDCTKCGFSPHTEISLAFQGRLRSIIAGEKIFY